MPEPIISCQSVSKEFRSGLRRRVRALDAVTLTVQPGEIFGLLGPNGAGKTTLVKVLLGLVRPTSGTASLFGLNTGDCRSRERVGYLPENPNFPKYLKGRKILDIFGGMSGVPWDVRTRRGAELLDLVKLTGDADRRVGGYSKGMVQRIGLAQALISDPDLVFLDEPTDGVDPIGRREIREILAGLKDAGKTVLLNSHLLSEVEMLCDRVAIMDNGRILAEGSLDDLTTDGGRFHIGYPHDTRIDLTPLHTITKECRLNDGRLEVTVHSLENLNQVIDLVRGQQVLISSVTPARQSLESYFINLITDVRGEKAIQ